MQVQTPRPNGAGRGTAEVNGGADILDQVMTRVPGLMDKHELELLHMLARQSQGTIVELGAAWGRSTVALCLGAQANGVAVVTVDAFASLMQGAQTEEPVIPDDLEPPTKEGLRDNLAAFSLAARIIDGLTWQAAEQVTDPVGFLFHDADHRGEAIARDLSAWAPKLTQDAIVAFHDYEQEVWPGVRQVADEWAQRHGWHKAERAGYLQVFRRGASAQNGAAVAHNGVEASLAAEAVADPTGPAATEATAVAQAYLQAFSANDLAACMAFYADDAVLSFLVKRFTGREEIEQWHKQRFSAKVEILSILSTKTSGDTVTVEAIVTSSRLKWWKIRLQGLAIIRVAEHKIRAIDLRPIRPLK